MQNILEKDASTAQFCPIETSKLSFNTINKKVIFIEYFHQQNYLSWQAFRVMPAHLLFQSLI